MRPGRLDRILYVGPPDQSGREEILKIRMRSMTVEPDIDIEEIARLVSSGASWVLRASPVYCGIRRMDVLVQKSLPYVRKLRSSPCSRI